MKTIQSAMRHGVGALLAGWLAGDASISFGQPYPSKHIRIVAAAVGGGNDLAARILAQKLSTSVGQPVIVENRGSIGYEIISKATPDGYSLLFYSNSLWISPFLRDAPPFDPQRDFAAIGLSALSPNILVVHPSLPAKTLNDLIALAKAQPGVLNYGSSSTGSAQHLAAELLKSMAGINIMRIGYKGTGPGLNALLGNEVQLAFATPGSVTAHLKSGRLRALGISSAQRSALVPELPTLAESGLPGYEMTAIYGTFAPPKTPSAIINKLNLELKNVLAAGDVKEKFLSAGMEAVSSTPAEFIAIIKADMARSGKVIKDAGIRAD